VWDLKNERAAKKRNMRDERRVSCWNQEDLYISLNTQSMPRMRNTAYSPKGVYKMMAERAQSRQRPLQRQINAVLCLFFLRAITPSYGIFGGDNKQHSLNKFLFAPIAYKKAMLVYVILCACISRPLLKCSVLSFRLFLVGARIIA